jgi:hypothetical protein
MKFENGKIPMLTISKREIKQFFFSLKVECLKVLGNAKNSKGYNINTIYSDGKESFLFALLAYLCFHGLPGNVPKCTGASESTILGTIAPGKNFKSIILK